MTASLKNYLKKTISHVIFVLYCLFICLYFLQDVTFLLLSIIILHIFTKASFHEYHKNIYCYCCRIWKDLLKLKNISAPRILQILFPAQHRHHHQYFPFCDLNFLFYPVKYPISAELQEECCSGGLLLLGRIAAAQAGGLLLLGRIAAA